MTTVVYPDAFDPLTHGHIDIVRRAARLFNTVIVAVDAKTLKNQLLPLEERLPLVRQAFTDNPQVKVMPYDGLEVVFAQEVGARGVVRELKVVRDLEHELQMALMGRRLAPEVDHVCLMSAPEYTYITSAMVREIAWLRGDISAFVPPHVVAAVNAHLRAQSDT